MLGGDKETNVTFQPQRRATTCKAASSDYKAPNNRSGISTKSKKLRFLASVKSRRLVELFQTDFLSTQQDVTNNKANRKKNQKKTKEHQVIEIKSGQT